MSFVKDIVLGLSVGIPAWVRSVFIVLTLFLGSLCSLGINFETISAAMALDGIQKESILLSSRSNNDDNKIVSESAEDLYLKLSSGHGAVGVSVVSFEPEYQPKVLKVIARNGDKEFEKVIHVGYESYLSGGAKSLFIANREGIMFMDNITKTKILKEIGIKSCLAMPIMYRNICVGSLIVFFNITKEEILEDEYEYLDGSMKIELHQILEELYYK